MMTTGIVLIAFGLALIGWGVWAWQETRREHAAPEPPDPDPEPCDVCGRTITGNRCRIVAGEDGPDDGWAIVAYYHPQCCPITDPDHAHPPVDTDLGSRP